MAEALTTTICPVCSEELDEPKLLPCTHLVCKKCVIATLEKKTETPSGCPSCHHVILQSDEKDDKDLGVFVDNLPTDHVTWMKIQSQSLLSGSTACGICDPDSDSKAVSFCFQCSKKMCSTCTKCHSKFPCCSDHTVEELNSTTAELLAEKTVLSCSHHKEKTVQKYCSAHTELVCLYCCSSYHKDCSDVENIEVAAEVQRKDLAEQSKRLKQKEMSLSDEIDELNRQIVEAEAKFARMRDEVISTCTELIKRYEARKHELFDAIEKKEQAYLEEKLANRDQLEALRSDITAHTVHVNEMISLAPAMGLLATLGRLKSRLNALETKKAVTHDTATVGEVYFDKQVVGSLKNMADVTGEVRETPVEQDKVKLVKCLVCDTVFEGTFRYEVTTERLKKGVWRLESDSHIIRHLPWRMYMYPWGGTGNKHLVFYLHCAVPDKLRSCSCNVKFHLRILNTLPQGKPFERELETTYDINNTYRGWDNFISVTDLLDPNNGYVKDGKVTFEAHVVPGVPEWTWK